MTITATRSLRLPDVAGHVRLLAAVGVAVLVVVLLVTAARWTGVDGSPAPTPPGDTARHTPTATPFGQA